MLNANMANVKQLFRGRKVTGTFEKRARARQQCQQCNKTVLNQLPLRNFRSVTVSVNYLDKIHAFLYFRLSTDSISHCVLI